MQRDATPVKVKIFSLVVIWPQPALLLCDVHVAHEPSAVVVAKSPVIQGCHCKVMNVTLFVLGKAMALHQ